jgi:hypothetical protein
MENSRLDILLKRDWFLDESDIFEILDDLDEESYQYLVKNMSRYPQRVRDCIDPINWGIGPYRKWWGDYSDDQMAADKKEWEKLSANIANFHWKKYKEETNLNFVTDMPVPEKLLKTKADLESYISKKYQKGSTQTDENIVRMKAEIEKLENEYKFAKDIQKSEDDLRETSAKFTWHNQTAMRKVYEKSFDYGDM